MGGQSPGQSPLYGGRLTAGLPQGSKDLILRQAGGSRGTRADQGGCPPNSESEGPPDRVTFSSPHFPPETARNAPRPNQRAHRGASTDIKSASVPLLPRPPLPQH